MGTRVCGGLQQALCHLQLNGAQSRGGCLLQPLALWSTQALLGLQRVFEKHTDRLPTLGTGEGIQRNLDFWLLGKTGVVAARGRIPSRQPSHHLPDPRRRVGRVSADRGERDIVHLVTTGERPRRWMMCLTPSTCDSFPTPARPLGAPQPLTSWRGAGTSGKAGSVLSDPCSGAATLRCSHAHRSPGSLLKRGSDALGRGLRVCS